MVFGVLKSGCVEREKIDILTLVQGNNWYKQEIYKIWSKWRDMLEWILLLFNSYHGLGNWYVPEGMLGTLHPQSLNLITLQDGKVFYK